MTASFRILAIGDIMGKPGRRCLEEMLPKIKEMYAPSAVIVNGENAAGGLGLTRKIYDSFVGPLGIDCVTMGNHWHDKREIYEFMDEADRMVLPANMANVSEETRGLRIIKTGGGREIAVINLIGRAFMYGDNRCPFATVDRLLNRVPQHIRIRVVDIHAEASSEKQAMAHYLDGRISLLYGTHTHCPTADERVLGAGTGFTTDLGMTGPYDSVIGIRKEASILRLMTGEKKKWEPASADPWLCALIADIDPDTGKCVRVERLKWTLDAFLAAKD